MRLQQIRVSLGWSQALLAKKSGVSQAYISEIELRKKHPTIPIVIKLASALGVSVIDLIDEQKSKAVGE